MPVRLVNFIAKDASATDPFSAGFLCGDRVADIIRVVTACSEIEAACDPANCRPSALTICASEYCLAAAEKCSEWLAAQDEATIASLSFGRDEVRLLSPVPAPGKVFCLAQNFPSHIGETRQIMHAEPQKPKGGTTPKVFLKPTTNTICGDGDPIPISRNAQFIDYEGEMCVVIGKKCKYVEPQEAGRYIAGVTCMNDVSERDLLLWERTEEGPWDKFFDWLNGKWMDNFAPMGPCLVPAGSLDIDNLELTCSVNGEVRQRGNTSEMIHSAAQTVSYISQMLTLMPGDVIALGTPGGVGKAVGKKLVPGDVVTVEIEGVGVLTNPVVAESA